MDRCIICQKDSFDVIKTGVRTDLFRKVYKCNNCGHLQLRNLLNSQELQEYYSKDMQAKEIFAEISLSNIFANARSDIERRFNLLSKYFDSESNLLEIGSGYGMFIKYCNDAGVSITGYEISDERRKSALSEYKVTLKNHDISTGLVLEEQECFDGIVAFHVLEHIVDIGNFLKNIAKLLSLNGKVIFEVPNSDDYLLSECEAYSNFYWQPAHVSYFNKNTLSYALDLFGYKIVDLVGVQRYSIRNSYNWILNKKPELETPTFNESNSLDWLDEYYKSRLISEFKCDTLVVVAEKKGVRL